MDIYAPEVRSKIMASIRSQNTRPELIVRSALHKMGFRFTIHASQLPGKPDIALPRYRMVIWIHGCFWHGHRLCAAGRKRPTTNVEYWDPKLAANKRRDRTHMRAVNRLGWKNFVIWECEIKEQRAFAAKLQLFKRVASRGVDDKKAN